MTWCLNWGYLVVLCPTMCNYFFQLTVPKIIFLSICIQYDHYMHIQKFILHSLTSGRNVYTKIKLHVEFLIHYVKVWFEGLMIRVRATDMCILLNSFRFLKHVVKRSCPSVVSQGGFYKSSSAFTAYMRCPSSLTLQLFMPTIPWV